MGFGKRILEQLMKKKVVTEAMMKFDLEALGGTELEGGSLPSFKTTGNMLYLNMVYYLLE